MAKRAMIYCPNCRKVALPKEELYLDMPENNVFRCHNGHAFGDYMALQNMSPDLIKMEIIEKPQDNFVKTEFFVDPIVLAKFRERYPNRLHATVNSILSTCMNGDPVIIDGIQAKKLHDMGVKNGAEMVSALEATKGLESEIDGLKSQITMLTNIIAMKGGNAEA